MTPARQHLRAALMRAASGEYFENTRLKKCTCKLTRRVSQILMDCVQEYRWHCKCLGSEVLGDNYAG
jgi:hypothetical protein